MDRVELIWVILRLQYCRGMNYKLFIMCMVMTGLTSMAIAQDEGALTESTYKMVKQEAVKILLPGAGTLKGTVKVLNEKGIVPLAFIDIKKAKQLQADQKGYFEVELDTGRYEITISGAGYKNLVIKDFEIKWGKKRTIEVSLATSKGFEKK